MSGSRKKTKVLIMAGGTGGHVFPGIAVAKELQARGASVAWLVRPKSFEEELVSKAAIPLYYMQVEPLRNRNKLAAFFSLFKLIRSFFQALQILRKYQPTLVLGMGGFVAGPGSIAAWCLGIPVLIHEQNALPSMTNKILVRFASVIMESFEGTFQGKKVVYTGNPVRSNILALQDHKQRTHQDGAQFNLLILGGSLGAAKVNQIVPEALHLLLQDESLKVKLNIWHQTGRSGELSTKKAYSELGITATVDSFIDEMDKAYAFADLVVCRAGATTIAELCTVGLGAIFIPYPNAVDDHQTKNAQYLVNMQAAEIVKQEELTPALLCDKLRLLIKDRKLCVTMAKNAQINGQYHATAKVVEQCMLKGKEQHAQA